MESNKENKFIERIKKLYSDSTLSSTCHGIANIIRSSNLSIKIMWIIFIIISAGLCSFMIIDNIMSYLKYEVSTKTRVIIEYEPFFPTITICNINFLTSNFATKSIEKYKENHKDFNPLSDFFKLEIISELKQKNQDQIKKLGDSMQKLIFDCSFEFQQCNYSLFKYFFHPRYGNCYQFNSGYDLNEKRINLIKTTSSERTFALKLTLNVSIDDGLKFMSPSLGAVLLIHNQTTYPTMVDEITVSTKTETNIGLSRTFYKSQPYPYSICDGNTNDKNSFDSEYFKLVHEKTKGYTQTLCVYQCYQKLIIDRCNCHIDFYPILYSTNSCSLISDCVIKAANEIGHLVDTKCLKECPLECEGMWFDKTVSINDFSNPSFEESLRNYQEYKNLFNNNSINSNNLAFVNIFYKSFNHVSITENPTLTIIGLFSTIGGVAGLFLGASFLTLLELISVLMQTILIIKNKNKIDE